MTRLSIVMAALLLLASNLSARTIQGVVRADNDSTAIIGATCRLTQGSQFMDAVATDDAGEFVLTTNLKSKLTLEVSMTGYATTEILIESDKNVNLGTVYLSEAAALKGVEVTANSMVDAKGRTIVFPSAADVKTSSTALSLFQKLPLAGMEANPINRSISVDGGTPVILINGIPSTMDDFNAIQPKDIAKIEFSRITPARYADRGNKGLLSITLKKRNDGGQVFIWGRTAFNTAFVDGYVRASCHQGPSQFTLGYNPSWRNYQDVYDNSTESYVGDDFRVNLEEHDRNPFNYNYHAFSLKYDYSPSLGTLFSATFRICPNTTRAAHWPLRLILI